MSKITNAAWNSLTEAEQNQIKKDYLGIDPQKKLSDKAQAKADIEAWAKKEMEKNEQQNKLQNK